MERIQSIMSSTNSVSAGCQTEWTLSPLDIIENCPTLSTVTSSSPSNGPRKLQTVLINRYAIDTGESTTVSGASPSTSTFQTYVDSPLTAEFVTGSTSNHYPVDSSAPSPCSPNVSMEAVSSSTHSLDSNSDQLKHKIPKLRTSKPSLQEQCQICGDAASGFHCGAFVCEACKKFYVRASKLTSRNYVCSGRRKAEKVSSCHIDKFNRTSCSYCRYQKCLSAGMEIPGKGLLDTHSLKSLPCKVCGSSASGYHFGVLTCEGCKGFFRRLLQDGSSKADSLVCQADSKCDIDIQSRSQCRACRYNKCLAMGMSRTAARLGRQPNSVRYARIVENRPPKVEVIEDTDLDTETRDSKEGLIIDVVTSAEEIPVLNSPSASSYIRTPTLPFSSRLGSPRRNDKLDHPMDLSVSESVPLDLSPQVQSPYSSERYIDRFAVLFEASSLECYTNCDEGGMMDEGVDDNKFLQLIYEKFQAALRLFVKYSKKLDGFMQLNLEDRVTLTKCAVYRFVLLAVAQRYDLQTGRHYMFGLRSWGGAPARLIALNPDYKVLPYHFDDVARRIKQTACSREELGLLAILNIINTDNLSDVNNPLAVTRLYNNYMELLAMVTRDHADPAGRMEELNHVLSLCRHAAQEHAVAAKNVIIKNPKYAVAAAKDSEIIPQLYKELFSHTPWEHWKSD